MPSAARMAQCGSSSSRLVEAEHGHHRVADELLDDPAIGLDLLVPPHEVGVDHAADILGVEPPWESTVKSTRSANSTVTSLRCSPAEPASSAARFSSRGWSGSVDHRIAEHLALGLERGDGLIDRREVVRVALMITRGPPAHGQTLATTPRDTSSSAVPSPWIGVCPATMASLRIESSITTVSWIPPEAINGSARLPFDLAVRHYDDPPPQAHESLEELHAAGAASRTRHRSRSSRSTPIGSRAHGLSRR